MSSVFIQVFALTAVTFISTNIDNLIIYTGFLSSKTGSKLSMVIAYYVAMSILLLVIFCLSLFFSRIPAADIKYLGLVLSAVGLYLLVRHFLTQSESKPHKHYETRSLELMLGVTMLMDSFDTTSVFVPFFADTNEENDLVVIGSFISCFLVWGLSGLYISRLSIFKFITKYKNVITPLIIILVGFYIFMNTSTDVE